MALQAMRVPARWYVVLTYTSGIRRYFFRKIHGVIQIDSRRYEVNEYQSSLFCSQTPYFHVDPKKGVVRRFHHGAGAIAWMATHGSLGSPKAGKDMSRFAGGTEILGPISSLAGSDWQAPARHTCRSTVPTDVIASNSPCGFVSNQ